VQVPDFFGATSLPFFTEHGDVVVHTALPLAPWGAIEETLVADPFLTFTNGLMRGDISDEARLVPLTASTVNTCVRHGSRFFTVHDDLVVVQVRLDFPRPVVTLYTGFPGAVVPLTASTVNTWVRQGSRFFTVHDDLVVVQVRLDFPRPVVTLYTGFPGDVDHETLTVREPGTSLVMSGRPASMFPLIGAIEIVPSS